MHFGDLGLDAHLGPLAVHVIQLGNHVQDVLEGFRPVGDNDGIGFGMVIDAAPFRSCALKGLEDGLRVAGFQWDNLGLHFRRAEPCGLGGHGAARNLHPGIPKVTAEGGAHDRGGFLFRQTCNTHLAHEGHLDVALGIHLSGRRKGRLPVNINIDQIACLDRVALLRRCRHAAHQHTKNPPSPCRGHTHHKARSPHLPALPVPIGYAAALSAPRYRHRFSQILLARHLPPACRCP